MDNIKNIPFSTEELSGVMANVWPKLLDLFQETQGTLFVRPLSGYFEHLLSRQKNEKLEPIYCVSISFLDTALMMGRPMCRIDAYGEEWMLYLSPLDTQCVDWAPFTLIWNDLLESFQRILDQRELQKYCSPLQAEQAAWYCIGPILSMIGSMQKYRMDWLREIPAYQQLIKGDGFRVEFGEFWDWKIILACEKSEVDLFNSQSKNQTYHRFQNKVFDGKKFSKFDLSGCVFENCDFRGCAFLKTELNDCRFVNCIFHDVEVRDCQMAGSSIVGSTLPSGIRVFSEYHTLQFPPISKFEQAGGIKENGFSIFRFPRRCCVKCASGDACQELLASQNRDCRCLGDRLPVQGVFRIPGLHCRLNLREICCLISPAEQQCLVYQ